MPRPRNIDANLCFSELMATLAPEKIGEADPMSWVDDLVRWWRTNVGVLDFAIAGLGVAEPSCQVSQRTSEDIQWLLGSVPSRSLLDAILPPLQARNSGDKRLSEIAAQVDRFLETNPPSRDITAAPLSIAKIRQWSQCGRLPLAILASHLGRPWILASSDIVITLSECKKSLADCARIGDVKSAVALFEKAVENDKIELVPMVWRVFPGASNDDVAFPSFDPPATWWDALLRQSQGHSLPGVVERLLCERPHLSQDLAGAMLRSGLHNVETLAHASPGLSEQVYWKNRDGVEMVALGVVLDSWVNSLKRTSPSSAEMSDLARLAGAIIGGLPPLISLHPDHAHWVGLLRGILCFQETGVCQEGDDPHCMGLPTIVEIQTAVDFILHNSYENAPRSSLLRGVDLAVISLAGGWQTSGDGTNNWLGITLPMVRELFKKSLQHPLGSERRRDFIKAIQQSLNTPYALRGVEDFPPAPLLEWEIWSLLVQRYEAVEGKKKSTELLGGAARTIRQIERFPHHGNALQWPPEVAFIVADWMTRDEDLPPWLIAMLQVNSLSLGTGADKDGVASTGKRGRL